jgi:hypothetical protein
MTWTCDLTGWSIGVLDDWLIGWLVDWLIGFANDQDVAQP